MDRVQLISLDLDGTLLDPAGQITQASRDAIARARATGVRVIINTGRSVAEAFQYAGEAGCDSLVSALGGAAVADAASGRVLRRWDVPEDSGRRVLELPDLELERAKIYGVIGANGSGKSTFAKVLSGVTPADNPGRKLEKGLSLGYMPQKNYA